MCWYPPVLSNAVVPPQQRYPVGSVVSYNCLNGYMFNINPNYSFQHTISCQPNGTWSTLPPALYCEKGNLIIVFNKKV